MVESKTAKLETALSQTKQEVDGLKDAIRKISQEKNNLVSTVGTLNRQVADLEGAVKALQQWAKNQNDANGRHANSSRF